MRYVCVWLLATLLWGAAPAILRVCMPQNGKIGPPLLGTGCFDTNCTAVCIHCDSSTACRLCLLEPSLSTLGYHPSGAGDLWW